ncbi:MAG: DUF2142 domain-containing protein [Polyangiales bacterium]
MTETSAPAAEHPARAPVGLWIRRVWLAALFVLGLGFVVLIPPFQAVDEVAHWDRVWTVADGHYNCWRLPLSAAQFVDKGFRFDNRGPEPQMVQWSIFRELYAFEGTPGEMWIATNGCHYPPIGYIAPAIAARLTALDPPEQPRPHKMFFAFYAMRLANWLLFFACLVGAHRLGRYPMIPLVFASIPMVVHQAVSINNDAFQFGGLLLASALLTRAPTRRTLWSAIAIITLMSMIKPINAVAVPLVWIAGVWALRGARLRRRELAGMAVASLALPIGAWLLWHETMHVPILGLTTGMPVPNVDEARQAALLRENPLRVLDVLGWQLKQFFDVSAINGGWRGVLLALGWYRYVAEDYVYYVAIATFMVGLFLLRWDAQPRAPHERTPLWLSIGTVGGTLAYFAVVTLILYTAFTPVGAELVFGVQGRYFLYPLAVLLFLHGFAREGPPWLRGRPAVAVACVFVALAIGAQVAALVAIRQLFWQA